MTQLTFLKIGDLVLPVSVEHYHRGRLSLLSSLQNATAKEVTSLVDTCPENTDDPAGVGPSNTTYPEFKRLAAILGDWEFTFMSRLLLKAFPPTVPAWSYRATHERGIPILGTYHSTDMPRLWSRTDQCNDVSTAMQDLYISFVDCLDPNKYVTTNFSGYFTFWPTWKEEEKLLELASESTRLIEMIRGLLASSTSALT